MSARSPLICSAVELWYKKMLKIGSLSELTGMGIKIKVAGFQRLYSKWLWLLMAVYKPSFADAENQRTALPADFGRGVEMAAGARRGERQ